MEEAIMGNKYDLVVIGGGPAGYVAAIKAAQYGKQVAVVDMDRPGGTCLNWGCIPTKALLNQAEFAHQLRHAKEYGFEVEVKKVDFPSVIARSRAAADKMTAGIEHLFRKNKVALHYGRGHIPAPGVVEVKRPDGRTEVLECETILVATGAKPRQLPTVPFDGESVISSKEAMVIKEIPKRLLIVGAGAIGVEFAYFFNEFGSRVTLAEFAPNILPIEDDEVSVLLKRKFESNGVEVLTGTSLQAIEKTPEGIKGTFQGAAPKDNLFDLVLVSIGIEARLEGLLGPNMKLDLVKGYIRTNDRYLTSVPGIYAVGDVIGPPWLAHKASWEAGQCVDALYGGKTPKKHHIVPGCTYCQPQVASVGATERKLKSDGVAYKVGKFPFIANGKAVGTGDTDGFIKLLYGAEHGELLGAHIVGHEATELISELNLALNLEATVDDVLATMHAHPTLSEVIADASAVAVGKAVHI